MIQYLKNKIATLVRNDDQKVKDFETSIEQLHIPTRKKYEGVNIIPDNYDDKKITILLLEDFKPFIDVMLLELSDIICLDKVNIIEANTQYGAFNALLALDSIKVDFAFCDITLGGMIFDGNTIKEYDGIDVFEKIMKTNPKAKVKLLTGHNLHSDKLEITDAIYKFNKIVEKLHLDITLDSIYINKRSTRLNMYYDLVNAIGDNYDEISAQ